MCCRSPFALWKEFVPKKVFRKAIRSLFEETFFWGEEFILRCSSKHLSHGPSLPALSVRFSHRFRHLSWICLNWLCERLHAVLIQNFWKLPKKFYIVVQTVLKFRIWTFQIWTREQKRARESTRKKSLGGQLHRRVLEKKEVKRPKTWQWIVWLAADCHADLYLNALWIPESLKGPGTFSVLFQMPRQSLCEYYQSIRNRLHGLRTIDKV